jgi:hypothetical protein
MIQVHASMSTYSVASKADDQTEPIACSQSLRKLIKSKVCITNVGTSRQEENLCVSERYVSQARRTLRP